MDKDRVEGKLKDVKGRIKRQAGEWTGDEQTQAEGALDQAEGKTQNAIGKAKDAGRKAVRDLDKKVNEDKKDDAA
ncbi:MAG: CsbD family protein [Terriglobia bacterium]|jgi:uncharacterized protein YjbJ (UPF0337 family)|nr:CsbD family protein [Terriglobia bacterium]